MRILHTVEFYYPNIGGAQEVVRHLSERMVAAGHDVTVATTKLPERNGRTHKGVKIVEFAVSGNTVRGIKGEKKKYQEFLKREKFDVIMNYAAQQWTADLFFEVIDDVAAVKIFVPCGYSALYDPDYKDYFAKLPDILRHYDATVYLAEHYRDIDFARKHRLKHIVTIPNGADENEFAVIDPKEKRSFKAKHGIKGLTISTLGNHTGEKGHVENIKALKYAPLPGATLLIIGTGKKGEGCWEFCNEQAKIINNGGKKYLGKQLVLVDGSDRKESVRALKASDIFLFLSNIEASPIVLFEAAASGVPFIATASGNNNEIARWTGDGVIVKSLKRPNGRVEADLKNTVWRLTNLALNKSRRTRMGRVGRQVWQRKYTWDRLAKQYISLYERLLKEREASK